MTDTTNWAAILDDELARHPGMDASDLRKLVYQSALGGNHLLDDPVQFAAGVRDEWERLGVPARGDGIRPAIQPIDPAGRTARIHLAICKAIGVPVDGLIELLLAQPRKAGSRVDFDRAWSVVLSLAETGRIPFDADGLWHVAFAEGAPHHSDGYGPASYRIVNDLSDAATADGLTRWGIVR